MHPHIHRYDVANGIPLRAHLCVVPFGTMLATVLMMMSSSIVIPLMGCPRSNVVVTLCHGYTI